MLPYALCSALQGALSGMLVTRTGSYRPIMWGGWVVTTIGSGLMIMLDSTSSMLVQLLGSRYPVSHFCSATQEIYPFIAALGIGCLFQVCQTSPIFLSY